MGESAEKKGKQTLLMYHAAHLPSIPMVAVAVAGGACEEKEEQEVVVEEEEEEEEEGPNHHRRRARDAELGSISFAC